MQTWNPFWINFQHLWRLTKDAFHTKDWKAKFYIWFKPTGWRPEDVKEKYPIQIITDVYSREKYVTKEKIENKLWAIFQFIGINFLLYYFLTFFSDLSPINRLEIGAIIMTSIFGFTSVMDGLKWSKSFEFLRCSSALIYFTLPYKWDLYESSSQIFLYFIVIYLSLTLISLFFISLPEKLMYAKG